MDYLHQKPRLLIISHVKPYPRNAGQQVRAYNKIVALCSLFEIAFLTFARPREIERARQELDELVDHAIVLPSVSQRHLFARLRHKLAGGLHTAATGLKGSNYIVGQVELSPARIAGNCPVAEYDLVLYEYWHATDSVTLFQNHGTPCVLDMHDVLWQSYERQLVTHSYPWMRALRPRLVKAYRQREEAAWARYDALIAISAGEAEYVRSIVPRQYIFLAPMGTDLTQWPYCWAPAQPPRLAFYGNLGSRPNQKSVNWCMKRIMPLVWQQVPEAEFWVVGANPSPQIEALQEDARVQVTGFVSDVIEVLATMTAVLCPWEGTYGFRSRLIEVMALGVPVIATPDAVYGMGLDNMKGIFLTNIDEQLAKYCLGLIKQPGWRQQQSLLARRQIEEKFSFEATYGQLAEDLYQFACQFSKQCAPGKER
jgi:glycosyltransferase involved in cell wall biosynthesis